MGSAPAPVLELPTFKGRPGWEFTDMSGLDLTAYEPAPVARDGAIGQLWSLDDAELPAGVAVDTDGDNTTVTVGRNVVLDRPISLTAVQSGSGTLVNQRTRIVLEEGAQAEVWEQFLSASDDLDGIFNVTTELVVGDNAHLRYVCGQALSETLPRVARGPVGIERHEQQIAVRYGLEDLHPGRAQLGQNLEEIGRREEQRYAVRNRELGA